jgi:hypothetical protein
VSVPSDPLAAAARVQTPLQAARLNDELETELALNDELDPAWEAAAEQARDQLAERFGGFDALHEKTQGKQPKSAVKDGTVVKPKKPAAAERAPSAKTSKEPAPRTARGSGSPAGRGRASAGSTKTGRRRTPRGVRRFAGQVAAPYGDAGSLGLWLVAGSIGLALLYVLISGRGPDALKWSTATWTRALRAFLLPTDPLARSTSTGPATGADAPATTGPGISDKGAGALDTTQLPGGFPKTGPPAPAVPVAPAPQTP